MSREDLSASRRQIVKYIDYCLICKVCRWFAAEGVTLRDANWLIKELFVGNVISTGRDRFAVEVRWFSGVTTQLKVDDDLLQYQRVKVERPDMLQRGQEDPTAVLRGNLSARSELHRFRLDKHFPKRVREVKLEKNIAEDQLYIIVVFQNGHVIKKPEIEAGSGEFMALCGMLYDLPPKE